MDRNALLARERAWVEANWLALNPRLVNRVCGAATCCICGSEDTRHEYTFFGRKAKICDECYHAGGTRGIGGREDPAEQHDARYHGGFGSETINRFREADDLEKRRELK